ncbi:hypothetical protein ACS0TY_030473 [Phlomoides rotata]
MAESPSSTSEKPPIEKLGLGLLLPDSTPSDPINPASQIVEIQHPESSENAPIGECDSPTGVMVDETVNHDEDTELRNAIETDLYQLAIEQAEIEGARVRSGTVDGVEGNDFGTMREGDGDEGSYLGTVRKGDEDEGNDLGTVRKGDEHEENNLRTVRDGDGDEGNDLGTVTEGDGDERNDLETVTKGDGDEGNQLGIVTKGGEDEEKDGKELESVEDDNENDGADEEIDGNVASKYGDGMTNIERGNQSNNRRKSNYPMRPDAEDCTFYMKFGSCKFGLNCKFNHPPRRKNQGVKERTNHREENPERAGQTECKYYLTSGGCKYGKDCKYSHGSDKSSTTQIPEFNFLGLPIRMGEKECPYYMRTGSCKYGSNCRFHHPEPVTVVGGDSPSGYGNGASLPSQHVPSSSATSWSSPRAFNESSPFVPVMFPPHQGATNSNQDWNRYQAATFPTSERSLPTPPAFAINNLPTENNFPMHHQRDILVEEYPERPGESECTFFMKTGDCKFRSNCRFHHPKNRISKAKANSSSYALNDKGLPLRPDQPICTHYHRYGICKYGPGCKYDHPANFAILPTPFDQSPFEFSPTPFDHQAPFEFPPTPFDQSPFGNPKILGKGK